MAYSDKNRKRYIMEPVTSDILQMAIIRTMRPDPMPLDITKDVIAVEMNPPPMKGIAADAK
jgi:hypothetical protein